MGQKGYLGSTTPIQMKHTLTHSKITMLVVEKGITNEMVQEKIRVKTYPSRTCPSRGDKWI